MGCSYEIDFDPKYTVIIGDNRQGKTLVARLIMLALYGIGRERDLHDSWKLRQEELLGTSDAGVVELTIARGQNEYRIEREFRGKSMRARIYEKKSGSWVLVSEKDSDIKAFMEDEIGITPSLMNVVMSNEQSLIGALSYDEKLQSSVWQGWKWKAEFIRDNIKKARDKCAKEVTSIEKGIEALRETIGSIQHRWIEKHIFESDEITGHIDNDTLEKKLSLITKEINRVAAKIEHYSTFHEVMIKSVDLESVTTVDKIIGICNQEQKFLDEKDDIRNLMQKSKDYKSILETVMKQGGEKGIENQIRSMEDERRKLEVAKKLTERVEKPIKVECRVYPPENDKKLVVEIPDNIADQFEYQQIQDGGIAVPYNEEREKEIITNKGVLEELVKEFHAEKQDVKESHENVRDQIGRSIKTLNEEEKKLGEQKTVFEENKSRYLQTLKEVNENEKMLKKLDLAKSIFDRFHNALSEEESLRKIRKETVAFINRIYEKVFEWDILAELENEERIVIKDARGNLRSHPSGSETHVMGLAWRWMVARGFDLPIVLDELDSLLDSKNFERTRRLIEEEMDRQTVILTLKEGLRDLQGKIYRVARHDNTSTLVCISQ